MMALKRAKGAVDNAMASEHWEAAATAGIGRAVAREQRRDDGESNDAASKAWSGSTPAREPRRSGK